ncbi:hypothetical protein Dda_5905 [Drechslerella dactyloides]|uniref:Uncharacterized protein n=1 Tax=Drechslerella dactyloides TaxID=74499 RepID=A0AAD6IW25_DREDA|nr:hypothetical protein Dda_5905 [Drechslerella dactyloides]
MRGLCQSDDTDESALDLRNATEGSAKTKVEKPVHCNDGGDGEGGMMMKKRREHDKSLWTWT